MTVAFSSSALLGLVSLIFLLTIPHRFSMGFRSGEFALQMYVSKTLHTQSYQDSSLSLRRHTHGPLAERLMHTAHESGNTSGVAKSSSDWLNYTGFPGDMCVAFFNVPPGNKDAVMPNPPHERRKPSCLQM